MTLRVLWAHNRYQKRGGEDTAFDTEADLLSANGHIVLRYARDNREIERYGVWKTAALGANTIWSYKSYRELKSLIAREKPDVAHFQNTVPLISPSAYDACQDAGVPVVQSLHNYRLLCPASTFIRDGKVCEDCLHHGLWQSIRYRCYRGSRLATSALALMVASHRMMGTWARKVDRYICLSEFARAKFIEGGLPENKISVKPNCVYPDPGTSETPREYALFVGRLSHEKGVRTLLLAWEELRNDVPLWIVGDGPLFTEMECFHLSKRRQRVRFAGQLSRADTLGAMKGARCLIVPSTSYEAFPMVVVEAFACGTPVICADIGALAEIVEHGRTGLRFTPGESSALAEAVDLAWGDPQEMSKMGREARAAYEEKYNGAKNYGKLMEIYEETLR